ncbi:chorismate mutase [Candidatus Saccharibacteria bacterium]|nr:chorismate mutase [Candidatus Saccharibacteria bacterium]
MTEQTYSKEPDPQQRAVREFFDPRYEPLYETLGEIRQEVDSIDIELFAVLAPLLVRRADLVIDATRFKENEDQVVAIDRQMTVLEGIEQLAESENFPYPEFMVDTFDAIVTWCVERQKQAFALTRQVEK